jgi:hypothetical protein
MITCWGNVYLRHDEEPVWNDDVVLTLTPVDCGTQLMEGGTHSQASDVYAYGICLWELLTWNVPWEDMSGMQVIHKVPYCRHCKPR